MEVTRVEKRVGEICNCPRCRVNTKEVTLGQSTLRECPVCEGLWVDSVALHQICTDRERQTTILGNAADILPTTQLAPERVRYIPCPICKQHMHRVNFAKCSNVIVDVCKPHGTWFDKDELHRIVKFISAGGMDVVRAREMEELDRKRRGLEATRNAAAASDWEVHRHYVTARARMPSRWRWAHWWVRSLIKGPFVRGIFVTGISTEPAGLPIPLTIIPLTISPHPPT
jgi:Zn-finger nucleic acid-binding protein